MSEALLTGGAATTRGTTGLRAAALRHLRLSVPAWRTALLGGMFWGFLAGVCAASGLHAEGWQATDKARAVVALFAVGGFLSFPISLFSARLLCMGRAREVIFAAHLLALGLGTIVITAALFALQYRLYYAEWHAEPGSKTWIIQFAFTVAGALYQFAVLGVRLYFPLGFLALFAASLWFARRPR